MKVYIGPYINRFICNIHTKYMNKKYDYIWPEKQTKFEIFLEKLEDIIQFIYNYSINLIMDNIERKEFIKIHNYDVWSMDCTLSLIILPMLKKLKQQKIGAPYVDNEDVPQELKSNQSFENDEKFFEKWEYVLNEMIFAFDSKVNDWQEKFFKNDKLDIEGMKKYQKRITNGFRLFGKYFEGLWD